MIYYDDFEVGNPLGSHSGINKLGGVYFSLPCLPPQYISKLENIYLALLFKSSYREMYGDKAIFQILVDELKYLKNVGIKISNMGVTETVYFELGLILGDNLGQNSLLGFIEGFTGNKCCRFCRMPKNIRNEACEENIDYLRNIDNYNEDSVLNNAKLTGIKKECVFNDLPGFHVTTNYCTDFMHDLLEGVCKQDFTYILKELIIKQALFSMDTFNYRIKLFKCYTERIFHQKLSYRIY